MVDNECKSSSGHKLASLRRSCFISTLSLCLLSRSFSLLSRDSVTLSGRLSLSRLLNEKVKSTDSSLVRASSTYLQIVFLVYW